MADTRTLVEGDLNKPRRDNAATQIESTSSGTLPSFKDTASTGTHRPHNQHTQIYRPDDSIAPSDRKLIGWLYTFSRKPTGEFFVLYEGKTTIGSDRSNDVVLSDPNVSAKHCFIVHRASKQTFVKDEGSTNGTFVNGEELVDSKKLITDGDEVKIANIVCTVRLVKEAMPAPAPAQ